jgi:hypothetical protein
MGSFDVRPDPAFPPTPLGDAPMLGPRKPFTQDPSKGVLVFELQMGDPPPEGEGPDFPTATTTYELFVLREYLIKLADEGQERLRRSRLPASDENRLEVWDVLRNQFWSEWGESNARFLTQTMSTRSWVCPPTLWMFSADEQVCSCSGYRYISLADPDETNQPQGGIAADLADPRRSRPQDLLMLDFSPYSVKRARSKGIPATSDLDLELIDMELSPPIHDSVKSIRDGQVVEPGPSHGSYHHSDNGDDDNDDTQDWTDDDMSIDHDYDHPYQTTIPSQEPLGSGSDTPRRIQFSHEPLEIDVIDDLSCIEMGNCWKEDIWSGLPFVRIRKEMGIVASGVMIDDQRVMMVSVSCSCSQT